MFLANHPNNKYKAKSLVYSGMVVNVTSLAIKKDKSPMVSGSKSAQMSTQTVQQLQWATIIHLLGGGNVTLSVPFNFEPITEFYCICRVKEDW